MLYFTRLSFGRAGLPLSPKSNLESIPTANGIEQIPLWTIPLAVGILSKLDYGDKGSPALPKDSRVKYNTGDSY